MSSNGNPPSASIKLPVYLDNHATTPLDPRVLEAMLPFLSSKFGNAASNSHSFGWEAAAAVETARRQIAAAIGASPQEIVFTSGATESNNLAVKGVAEACRSKGDHVITALSEHKAILDSCKQLEKHGCRVTYLRVQPDGLIDLDQLKNAFTGRTILVTIMAANNETGVLQPIEEIGQLCRERGVLFHSDAVQALGKVPVDVKRSSGSACSSGKTEASHVLKALGLTDEAAGCAIRFGIGRFNTEAEINYVAGRVIELVKNLREVSTLS